MNFAESSINQEMYSMMNDEGVVWDNHFTEIAFKVMLDSIAAHLGDKLKADPSKKYSVVIKDRDAFDPEIEKAKVLFVATASEQDNDDNNGVSFTLSVDEGDVPEDSEVEAVTDEAVRAKVAINSANKWNMHFRQPIGGKDFMNIIFKTCIYALKKCIRDSVNIDPVIDMEGFFRAEGSIKDGKLSVKLIPSETLKQQVKGDKEKLEKTA